MSTRWGRARGLPWAAVVFALRALGGCGEVGATGEACSLLAGDLVVTELMVDPAGEESAGEWIELHNATGGPVVLDRLVVSVGANRSESYELRDVGTLAARGYFVIGNGAASAPHLDHGYGSRLGLSNTGAVVRLECGGSLVDAVAYGASGGPQLPGPGRSLSLDGGLAPDAVLNDSAESWCAGAATYDGTSRGTPGGPNQTCGLVTCEEGALERAVSAPSAGELVVSEIFADAEGVEDGKEWLELYSTAAVDLNGLVVEVTNLTSGVSSSVTLHEGSCLAVAPGAHVVLGGSVDAAVNGGVPVDLAVPGFQLPSAAALRVRLLHGGEEVDVAHVPFAPAGVSVRVDDSLKHAAGNDTAAAFCEAAESQLGTFGRGTPGGENGGCGTLACREGEVRPVRAPTAGELVVSEVFAKSSRPAIEGGGRDWLELYVAADHVVDLNGLTIEVESGTTGSVARAVLASESCVPVQPGTRPVVAHATDPLLTGGVRASIAAPALAVFNDPPLVVTVRSGEVLIDEARVPAAVAGRSASLHPELTSAAANDDVAAFCHSEATLVFDERGTPGRENLCGALCTDRGVQRRARAPSTGTLVVTEVSSDAAGVTAGSDWVEALATTALDLNGLVVRAGSGSWTLPGAPADACVPVAAGGFVVVGGVNALGVSPGATIGGPADTLFPANPAGTAPVRLALVHRETLVDEVYYPQRDDPVRPLVEGASFALHPDATAADLNDDPESWCVSSTPTPAGANALQCW